MRKFGITLGFLAVLVGALLWSAPASLLAPAIEFATNDRLTLAGASGRIQAGEAVLLAIDGGARTEVTWRLSLRALLSGYLIANLTAGHSAPFEARVGTGEIAFGTFSVPIPAGLVAQAVGQFGDHRVEGEVLVQSESFAVSRDGPRGKIALQWRNAGLRSVAVAPLGTYQLEAACIGSRTTVKVRTLDGPLAVDGEAEIAKHSTNVRLRALPRSPAQQSLVNWLRGFAQQQPDGSFRFELSNDRGSGQRTPKS